MKIRFCTAAALTLAAVLWAAGLWAEEEYDIGPLDVLHVVVLGQPEMSGDFSVSRDGTLDFPFVGTLKASAMTPREFEKKLVALLSDGYLKRPQVAVSLKEYRSQRVFVTGEVQKPGPYSLGVERTLLALLAQINPLSPNAGHEVIVTREPPPPTSPSLFDRRTDDLISTGDELPMPLPTPEVFRLKLRDVQSGRSESNLLLKAGDNVLFPKASSIYVSGHVARPGPYRYEEGITFLQVLNMAGGVTERGAAGRAKIVRFVDGKATESKAKPTDVLLPEDTVVVPERFF